MCTMFITAFPRYHFPSLTPKIICPKPPATPRHTHATTTHPALSPLHLLSFLLLSVSWHGEEGPFDSCWRGEVMWGRGVVGLPVLLESDSLAGSYKLFLLGFQESQRRGERGDFWRHISTMWTGVCWSEESVNCNGCLSGRWDVWGISQICLSLLTNVHDIFLPELDLQHFLFYSKFIPISS